MGESDCLFLRNYRREYCRSIGNITNYDVLFRTDQQLFSADQYDSIADCESFGAKRFDFHRVRREQRRSAIQQSDKGSGMGYEPQRGMDRRFTGQHDSCVYRFRDGGDLLCAVYRVVRGSERGKVKGEK